MSLFRRRDPAAPPAATGTSRSLAGGPGVGENTRLLGVLRAGPSVQSQQLARTLAVTLNTASPASRGSRVWRGDPGFGVNRFERELAQAPTGSPAAGAISPLSRPVGVKINAGGGPSSPSGFPSTGSGGDDPYGSVGMLDIRKLGNMGWH